MVRSLISSNTSVTSFKSIWVTSVSRVTVVKSVAAEIVAVILVALGKVTSVKADPASATAPVTEPLPAAVTMAPNSVALLVVVTVTAIPSTSVIAPLLSTLARIFAELSLNFV